jgi:hypothetical protein
MSDLRLKVRSSLASFLSVQDGYHLKTDILRIIEEEALLMKQTEYVMNALDRDVMGQLSEVTSQVESLKKIVRVTSYDKIRTIDGYSKIDAVLSMRRSPSSMVQLTFRYERKRREESPGCRVRYSIEMSKNHQQRENLVVVEVWSPQDGPSSGRAVCINQPLGFLNDEEDNDADGWEDISENDLEQDPEESAVTTPITASKSISSVGDRPADRRNHASKRQKLSEESRQRIGGNSTGDNKTTVSKVQQELEPAHDEFLAYLDPDLMHEFLELAGLHPMSDGTAFFLLMTFPFYENEWDLVGFLLDEIFGDEDEDDEGE